MNMIVATLKCSSAVEKVVVEKKRSLSVAEGEIEITNKNRSITS